MVDVNLTVLRRQRCLDVSRGGIQGRIERIVARDLQPYAAPLRECLEHGLKLDLKLVDLARLQLPGILERVPRHPGPGLFLVDSLNLVLREPQLQS